jgi:hypothetical protein
MAERRHAHIGKIAYRSSQIAFDQEKAAAARPSVHEGDAAVHGAVRRVPAVQSASIPQPDSTACLAAVRTTMRMGLPLGGKKMCSQWRDRPTRPESRQLSPSRVRLLLRFRPNSATAFTMNGDGHRAMFGPGPNASLP